MAQPKPVTVFAPAKINLYLHVTGRRTDGYHLLDSLAVFADIGDRLTIEPARDFSFRIDGLYARAFCAAEQGTTLQSKNLVARAARAMSEAAGRPVNYRVTLTKMLPLAAGIGGGSADAAAMIWGLLNLWDMPLRAAPFLPGLMSALGADVPACLRCLPVKVGGTGDLLDAVPGLPEMPVVLANCGKHCPTPEVFRRFKGPMRGEINLPGDLSDSGELIAFLKRQENDLTGPACEVVPDIVPALEGMAAQGGCLLPRMSGSGATVFGLFDSFQSAEEAAANLAQARPSWWVRAGTINSPARY